MCFLRALPTNQPSVRLPVMRAGFENWIRTELRNCNVLSYVVTLLCHDSSERMTLSAAIWRIAKTVARPTVRFDSVHWRQGSPGR